MKRKTPTSKAQKRVMKYGQLIRRLRGIQANLRSLAGTEFEEFTNLPHRAILRDTANMVSAVEGGIIDKWHGRNEK